MQTSVTPETLLGRKDRKGLLLQGAAMFNQKPKTGIAFLEQNGIITVDADATGESAEEDEAKKAREQHRAAAIARFLRSSSRLDKKELGEYIARPDQEALLRAFMQTFDFRGVSYPLPCE